MTVRPLKEDGRRRVSVVSRACVSDLGGGDVVPQCRRACTHTFCAFVEYYNARHTYALRRRSIKTLREKSLFIPVTSFFLPDRPSSQNDAGITRPAIDFYRLENVCRQKQQRRREADFRRFPSTRTVYITIDIIT